MMRINLGHLFNMQIPGLRADLRGGVGGNPGMCMFKKHLGWFSEPAKCGKSCFGTRLWAMPWRRAWQPTPVFLPGESHRQRSLVGYTPWGCKELDVTGWLRCTQVYHFRKSPEELIFQKRWLCVFSRQVFPQSEDKCILNGLLSLNFLSL